MGYPGFQGRAGAAWAGLTVEESNLSVQIAALRRVFGEEPGCENWIETLPRRGYRFVGPASTRDQGALTAASRVASEQGWWKREALCFRGIEIKLPTRTCVRCLHRHIGWILVLEPAC